jgi:phosphatidylserine/phosphatidylglycerophosphate/cardiolipin synthase-like enzyme
LTFVCAGSLRSSAATVLPQIRKDHRIVGADNLRPHKRVAAAASLGSIARASQKLNTIALSQFRVSLTAVLFLTSLAPCGADLAPVIHYAPGENLEHVDVALIDRARHEIDMAAYVLTDWRILQALTRAADRGVKVRIYLDGTQLAEREPAKVFNDLAETPGVEITIKRKRSDLMHLKSYQIDGRLLRTGAANFSASGLKRQDNDLIVIESPGAAASFKRNFEARYASGG